MPVVERSGDIPDYANCEVARINRAYKDDDEGNSQGLDCVFRMLRDIMHIVTLKYHIGSKIFPVKKLSEHVWKT